MHSTADDSEKMSDVMSDFKSEYERDRAMRSPHLVASETCKSVRQDRVVFPLDLCWISVVVVVVVFMKHHPQG